MNRNHYLIQNCIGKTIFNVEDSYDDIVLISFDDGSFSVIKACGDNSQLDFDSPLASLKGLLVIFTDSQLMRAGIATEQEIREAREKEKLAGVARMEEFERQQLARLQAKYGNS